ncbi:MAG TPA: sigma-70 family RNA polymerase sigma factor [Acidimicrobiales bacterium]|nr:sigma-70 family RNA polymerase sigma factor [Acidimicrobiales bacterium]
MSDRIPFSSLLLAAQQGDEEAFAVIWRACQPLLLRYLRVNAGGAADDIAADAWLQVSRKLSSFEGGESEFRAWLFTIARNRHIDWRRRSSNRRETPVESEILDLRSSPEDPALSVETQMSTDRALALIATLPPSQAEAVMLREVIGLSVADVAKVMDRPAGTVRVLCHRGLRRLADVLQSRLETEALDAQRVSG